MAKLSEVMGAIAPGTEQIAVSDYRPMPGQTNGLAADLDYRDFAGLSGEGEVDELDSLGWLGASEDDLVLTIDGLDEGDLGLFEAGMFKKASVRQLEGRRAAAQAKLDGLMCKQRKPASVIKAIQQLRLNIRALNRQIDAARRAAVARTDARAKVVAAMGTQNGGGLFSTLSAQAKGLANKAAAIDAATDAVVAAKAQQDLVPAAEAAPAFQQDVSIDSEDAEVEGSLDGLGRVSAAVQRKARVQSAAKPRSMMDRIIATDRALKTRVAMNVKAKRKLAASSPTAAIKLAQQAAKSKQPGTSVARAVVGGMNSAAKYARLAKKYRAKASQANRRNDKRLAAAYMVKALEYARKAGISATQAEKTRVAVGLDRYNKVFTAQAKALRDAAQKLQRSGTNSGKVAQLLSQASALEANAKKLRAQAANVEAQPNEPAGLPSPKRIAEVANKFNVRTSFKSQAQDRRALISVLGEAYDAPLAQVDDYEGALAYYGGDELGALAANIEFGRYSEADAILQGLGDWKPDWLKKGLDAGKDLLNKAKDIGKKIDEKVIQPAKNLIGPKAAAAAKPPAVSAPAPATPAASSAVDAASSVTSSGSALTASGDDTIFGLPKMAVYGGGAALVLGAAWFLTRKK
jgi:hypothetical protein